MYWTAWGICYSYWKEYLYITVEHAIFVWYFNVVCIYVHFVVLFDLCYYKVLLMQTFYIYLFQSTRHVIIYLFYSYRLYHYWFMTINVYIASSSFWLNQVYITLLSKMTLLIACALIANISLHSVLVTSQHQENSPLLTVWIVSLAGLRNTIVGISYVFITVYLLKERSSLAVNSHS